jgi:hypothetical protein
MEDIESLRPTDIEALQDGIPHHVVIDVDARLLADDFAILVEDIKDTRFAPRLRPAMKMRWFWGSTTVFALRPGPSRL